MTLLDIDGLSAGYGKLEILHRLSLSVPEGQFLGIFGPNGSGKSTLIKSVFGLTTIFEGSIRFGGQRLDGLPTERLSGLGVAYVPQTRNVFTGMSIRENLQLAARRHPDPARGLAEVFDLFPILGQRQAQRGGKLSGGERQMLAISLALLQQPRLLLLDEPSAALSPLLVNEIFRQLRRLADRGITLVVVEQNARSLLRWCDYGVVLREGQIVFRGTAATILADEETAKNFLGIGQTRAGN